MSELIVTKFGGSSLADSAQFRKVRSIVLSDPRRRIVVPSAPGKRFKDDQKVTDLLYLLYEMAVHGLNIDENTAGIRERFLEIVKRLGLNTNIDELLEIIVRDIRDGAGRDYVASRGEYINGILLAEYLGYLFIDAKNVIFFHEDGSLNDNKTYEAIADILSHYEHVVIPGFYGTMPNGEIKTFSRGGSDLTGSVAARGAKALRYENWTDVSGFLMADPKIVQNPKKISYITYRELRELSYSGAGVLHEDSIFPVIHEGIPIHIKNTDAPTDPGTYIVDEDQELKDRGTITGVTGKRGFSIINVRRAKSNRDINFHKQLISLLESNGINLEHLPSSIDALYAIVETDQLAGKTEKLTREIKAMMYPDTFKIENGFALVAVVGKGMMNSPSTQAKIFSGLAKAEINTRAIVQGSAQMSVIIAVDEADYENAVRAIYNEFER